MNSPKTAIRAIVILLVLGWCTSVLAQSTRQMTYRTIVKPGMNQQYEDYIKKYVEAANKLGNVQPWAAFQTTVGGPAAEYFILLPFDDWGDRDAWTSPQQLLIKAFGEEEAAKVLRTGQAAVVSTETYITENQSESTATGGGSIAAYYTVSSTHVIPSKINDYRLAISKVWSAEAKATGAPPHTMRRVITGDRWMFSASTPFANGAARDKWPKFRDYMSAQYSDAEIRQILADIQGATDETRWFEVAHRPDLSNSGATATND